MYSSPYKQQGHISIYSVCFAVCQKVDVLLQTLVVSYTKRNFLNIFYWEKVIYVTFVFVCETYVTLGLGVMMYLFVTEKKSGNFFVFCRKHQSLKNIFFLGKTRNSEIPISKN